MPTPVPHTHLSTPAPEAEDVNPFIDPPCFSLSDEDSPSTSVEPSKPKFKVGRQSKEDQEAWDQFVRDCDHMLLSYTKKKSMTMEQVFTQYSTLKKHLNTDS